MNLGLLKVYPFMQVSGTIKIYGKSQVTKITKTISYQLMLRLLAMTGQNQNWHTS
jgi:hypothetical protein